jgi:hypothetical protein
MYYIGDSCSNLARFAFVSGLLGAGGDRHLRVSACLRELLFLHKLLPRLASQGFKTSSGSATVRTEAAASLGLLATLLDLLLFLVS